MEQDGRVDQIIQPVLFADGGRFVELVPLKARALAGGGAGDHESGRFQHGQHIGVQHRGHGPVLVRVAHAAKAGVQIGSAVFGQHARVELRLVPRAQSQQRTVRIMNIAIEFIRSGGRVAHGHGDKIHVAEHVIQIVPPVRPMVTSGAYSCPADRRYADPDPSGRSRLHSASCPDRLPGPTSTHSRPCSTDRR